MYRAILVPTDGSDGSQRAAEHAVGLATAFGAAIHTLYVVDTTVGPDAGLAGIYDAFREAGEAAVDEVIAIARDAGVGSVEGSVARGTPHRAILDYADEHDIDLIVMGTHGRTGLERYLIGSVTERVVRTADVPVLTVRFDDARAEDAA